MLSTEAEIDRLADFAILLGRELLIIDDSTNRRNFADRICGTEPLPPGPSLLRSCPRTQDRLE
jgi:hypothetical protein